ncbi:MAG TPA: MotA/TolQ/ExbB proton channel family protein [Candidatus Babeliales bacterium]|nr:MotA/TolQ/ExbB proton channel family protein [Candidatus Babeliales bacterium]
MVGVYSNPVIQLITQSDAMTKIILLTLLALSIISWALFIYKLILGAARRRQLMQALKDVRRASTFDDLRAVASEHAHTMPGFVITKNLTILKTILETRQSFTPLSDRELEIVEGDLEQSVGDVLHTEESYLPFFAAIAAVSPLLGLFGTVWGLIHSFVRISEKQTADIPTIAPGIAEALITTLAGLMVAIPALMMFHYLSTRVRTLEYYLYNLTDRLVFSVNTLFLK